MLLGLLESDANANIFKIHISALLINKAEAGSSMLLRPYAILSIGYILPFSLLFAFEVGGKYFEQDNNVLQHNSRHYEPLSRTIFSQVCILWLNRGPPLLTTHPILCPPGSTSRTVMLTISIWLCYPISSHKKGLFTSRCFRMICESLVCGFFDSIGPHILGNFKQLNDGQ